MYQTLKKYLIFGILFVLMVFIFYSEYMMRQMEKEAETTSRIYGKFVASAGSKEEELDIIFDEVVRKINFPVIVTDGNGLPKACRNTKKEIKEITKADIAKLAKAHSPVEIKYSGRTLGWVYYGDSRARRFLKWAPAAQVSIGVLFLVIAFFWFRTAKRAEESTLWMAIAKEIAHQIGTPLSSLMGWTEYIKDKEVKKEVIRDTERLSEISRRFYRVGSPPSFRYEDLNKVIEEGVDYLRKRLPYLGKGVQIVEKYNDLPKVSVDKELCFWALENIFKNALDASAGRIEVETRSEAGKVILTIRDDGKGIARNNRARIFDAGYTTKEYGWGLGLALVKRIVMMHRGKIYIEQLNKETGFIIEIPV
jgi:hypothetical protein